MSTDRPSLLWPWPSRRSSQLHPRRRGEDVELSRIHIENHASAPEGRQGPKTRPEAILMYSVDLSGPLAEATAASIPPPPEQSGTYVLDSPLMFCSGMINQGLHLPKASMPRSSEDAKHDGLGELQTELASTGEWGGGESSEDDSHYSTLAQYLSAGPEPRLEPMTLSCGSEWPGPDRKFGNTAAGGKSVCNTAPFDTHSGDEYTQSLFHADQLSSSLRRDAEAQFSDAERETLRVFPARMDYWDQLQQDVAELTRRKLMEDILSIPGPSSIPPWTANASDETLSGSTPGTASRVYGAQMNSKDKIEQGKSRENCGRDQYYSAPDLPRVRNERAKSPQKLFITDDNFSDEPQSKICPVPLSPLPMCVSSNLEATLPTHVKVKTRIEGAMALHESFREIDDTMKLFCRHKSQDPRQSSRSVSDIDITDVEEEWLMAGTTSKSSDIVESCRHESGYYQERVPVDRWDITFIDPFSRPFRSRPVSPAVSPKSVWPVPFQSDLRVLTPPLDVREPRKHRRCRLSFRFLAEKVRLAIKSIGQAVSRVSVKIREIR